MRGELAKRSAERSVQVTRSRVDWGGFDAKYNALQHSFHNVVTPTTISRKRRQRDLERDAIDRVVTEGAREVVVLGTSSDEAMRLPKARSLGFAHAINVQKQDAAELVAERTGGTGADLVVECSGSQAGIASTVALVRKKGRICAIGLPGAESVMFPYKAAAFKVADLYFCLSTSYTSWQKAIHLVGAGLIDVEAIISHREPLANWEQVFKDIDTQRALKAVLIP